LSVSLHSINGRLIDEGPLRFNEATDGKKIRQIRRRVQRAADTDDVVVMRVRGE